MGGTSHFIAVGDQRLHYMKWGAGSKLLLAFHGYGNSAAIFEPMVTYLQGQYTILSFDLPHHGASSWPDGVMLKKECLFAAVHTLMAQYSADKVSLMGYSLGGRICMAIVGYMPERIDKVLLLATDGLAINKLYYFCTRTFIGGQLFGNAMQKPEKYIKIMEWLKKHNYTDASRYRFVIQYLGNENARHFLHQVWPALSDFMPDAARIKRLVKKYGIHVSIFMGTYDRIMPPALAHKFKEGLDTVQVFIFEKGHRVFDDSNAGEIARQLL